MCGAVLYWIMQGGTLYQKCLDSTVWQCNAILQNNIVRHIQKNNWPVGCVVPTFSAAGCQNCKNKFVLKRKILWLSTTPRLKTLSHSHKLSRCKHVKMTSMLSLFTPLLHELRHERDAGHVCASFSSWRQQPHLYLNKTHVWTLYTLLKCILKSILALHTDKLFQMLAMITMRGSLPGSVGEEGCFPLPSSYSDGEECSEWCLLFLSLCIIGRCYTFPVSR